MNRCRRFTQLTKTCFSFALPLLLMLVFRSAVADWMYVPTGSMNPTIIEGDRILVDKLSYGLRIPFTTVHLTEGSDPQRGDIVIFDSPQDDLTLVKRVIGLPGDTIEMRNEQLVINDTIVTYTPAVDVAEHNLLKETRAQQHRFLTEDLPGKPHAMLILPDHPALRSFAKVAVPPGSYLVLGDNRDNSKDSRYLGFIPRHSIIGRASHVVMSLNPENYYLPREDRFFRNLY